jgi:hypothetical protein
MRARGVDCGADLNRSQIGRDHDSIRGVGHLEAAFSRVTLPPGVMALTAIIDLPGTRPSLMSLCYYPALG